MLSKADLPIIPQLRDFFMPAVNKSHKIITNTANKIHDTTLPLRLP